MEWIFEVSLEEVPDNMFMYEQNFDEDEFQEYEELESHFETLSLAELLN